MRTAFLIYVALGSAVAVARADAAPPAPSEPVVSPKIEGAFAFDVTTPRRTCAKVTGALLTKLRKQFTCRADPDHGSASGKPVIAECTAHKGTHFYMVLATTKDCEDERLTQLANGESA
jgi:hypothetical protein